MWQIVCIVFAMILSLNAGYNLPSRSFLRTPQSFSLLSTTNAPAVDVAASTWAGAKKWSQTSASAYSTVMNNEQIAAILPHRYPFLLVDRVIEFEAGQRAVGVKCVTANEPQFTGHFPDRPIMPGVLMVEAMAQLGGLVALSPPLTQPVPGKKRIFFFTGVSGVRWKSPVTPGDVLVMEMALKSFDERLGFVSMTGKAYTGGKLAVSVEEFSFALAKD